MSPMTREDGARYEATKKCNYLCLFLVLTTAWTMSLYATGFCAFVGRDITLKEGESLDSVCQALDISTDQCSSLLSGQGVGFWAWEMTVPVDTQACFSYTQYVEGIGYVTPEFDRKFNSAKACQGVAVFFGALAWFTMAFSFCCSLSRLTTKVLAFYFFIAFLFQSLAFLIFKSDICQPDFFSAYFGGNLPDAVASVSCHRNRATNMAIAATVLYFYAMLMVLSASAPEPVYNLDAWGSGGKDEAAAAAAPAESPADGEEAPPAAEETA